MLQTSCKFAASSDHSIRSDERLTIKTSALKSLYGGQVMFKTRAASLLNGFKNIPGKACVKGVHNNDAFVNVVN